MRDRRIFIWVGWAFALALLLPTWSVADVPSNGAIEYVEGPTYTATEIRRTSILGIHLGMTPGEASQRMEKQGFHFLNPSKTENGGYYESADRRIWMVPTFTEFGGRRVLVEFTYMVRDYTDADARDVSARRAELLALLGQPTHWEKWTKKPANEIGDRFVYLPDRTVIDSLDQAESCFSDWECTSLRRNLVCRPLVHQVNLPVVRGSFGYRLLHITVTDYALRSDALLHDDRFQRRDLSGLICRIPTIH